MSSINGLTTHSGPPLPSPSRKQSATWFASSEQFTDLRPPASRRCRHEPASRCHLPLYRKLLRHRWRRLRLLSPRHLALLPDRARGYRVGRAAFVPPLSPRKIVSELGFNL